MRLFHLKVDFFQNITNKEDKGEVHSMLKKLQLAFLFCCLFAMRYSATAQLEQSTRKWAMVTSYKSWLCLLFAEITGCSCQLSLSWQAPKCLVISYCVPKEQETYIKQVYVFSVGVFLGLYSNSVKENRSQGSCCASIVRRKLMQSLHRFSSEVIYRKWLTASSLCDNRIR